VKVESRRRRRRRRRRKAYGKSTLLA